MIPAVAGRRLIDRLPLVSIDLRHGSTLPALVIGTDSLFFKHSEGLATTLVAKDRVLAHNPIGALNLAESYYEKVWGPERPVKAPKLPKQRRQR